MLALGLACVHSLGADSRPSNAASVIGHYTFVAVDRERPDPVAGSGQRRWLVRLFYAAESCRPVGVYADDPSLLEELKRQNYYQAGSAHLDAWRQRSAPTVSGCCAVQRGPQPVITLSPGFGVAGLNYSIIATELARRGFVVALIEHPYLGVSRLPDGRIMQPHDDPALRGDDQEKWGAHIANWARDISVTLNLLTVEPGLVQLGVNVELSGVTVAGHSLGGAAALDGCIDDDRVSACADFEGAAFGTRTLEGGPRKPVLFVLSRAGAPDRPRTAPDLAHPMFAFLAKGASAVAWAVNVTGGSHMSFSDAPLVLPDTLSRFGGSLMLPDRSMDVYSGMLAAFARAYRRGGNQNAEFQAWVDSVPEVRAAHTK